jgi:hypothetical protein
VLYKKDVEDSDTFRHAKRDPEPEFVPQPIHPLSRLLDTNYFASSFFRMRRISIKQSPEVVQRTQPIMMITFMSIRAGSLSRLCPANASKSF